MILILLWLAAYVAVDAFIQGKLTKLFRLYVPVVHQPTINLCLHVGAPVLYLLYSYHVCGLHWKPLLLALVVRLCLFDPILNLSKGDPLFAVGYSALTDKFLRKLAGARASMLSGAVRLGAVAAAALLLSACRSSRLDPEAQPWPVAPVSSVPVYGDGGVDTGKLPDSMAIKKRNTKETEKKTAFSGVFGIFGRKNGAKKTKEKIKNSTIIYQVGEGNTAAAAPKASAPVGAAAPGATQYQSASKTGVAQSGEGNQAKQEQAAVKPWYGFLLGPVGVVLGLAVAAALVYGVVQYRRPRTIV